MQYLLPSALVQHASFGPQHWKSLPPHFLVPLGQSCTAGLLGSRTHPVGCSGETLELGDSLETLCLFFSASVTAEDGLISQMLAQVRTAATASARASLTATDDMRMDVPPNVECRLITYG